MLPVKPFQQTTACCGPASLKMVLNYYGITKSEKALARMAGCTMRKGTSGEGMMRAAVKLGFRCYMKDFADLKDLRKYVKGKGIPVIVDWFSEEDGHYSVVVDIDNENVYIQDPAWGGVRSMHVKTFRRVWFDFPGDFIRSKDDLITRRLIVVKPPKKFSRPVNGLLAQLKKSPPRSM